MALGWVAMGCFLSVSGWGWVGRGEDLFKVEVSKGTANKSQICFQGKSEAGMVCKCLNSTWRRMSSTTTMIEIEGLT